MRRCRIFFSATVAMSSVAPAQTADGVPSDLNQFGLVCFCNSRLATPHMIVGYDNNGAVLYSARSGATREQLKAAGMPVSQNQVQTLKDWGLLREKNKVLTTSFPVLDPENMAKVRERLIFAKQAVLPKIHADVALVKTELARRGKDDWTYAFLFSYVLDGRVWHQLEKSGKLPSTQISIEHPYWAGTFWAVYPKQDAMPGTNSRDEGRLSLRMMWNPEVLEPINDFYGARSSTAYMRALEAGQTPPALFDDPKVEPLVIREDLDDPLFRAAERIAGNVAGAMIVTDLTAQMPQVNESQRLLIGTHEMIWLILADEAEHHGIRIPRVLADGARKSSDLAPLVIVSVSQRGTTAKH